MTDTLRTIFGLQVLLSLLGWTLIARWYMMPRLASFAPRDALVLLMFPHAFRHLGMTFLVPALGGPLLPPAFAIPAAYGDLAAALLALAAIIALRTGVALGRPLAWIFNIVGSLDLIVAFYRGTQLDVARYLGATWYIPTFVVPALLVTHAMIFFILLTRAPQEEP